jgi:hypothetical protein
MKWLILLALATTAFAADISGNWKATADMGQGPMERTFTFKQEGTKLTGETVSSFAGKSEIKDGKVEGDNVTFTISINLGDQPMSMTYKGKISGDSIKFNVEGMGGQAIVWDAKKVK